MLGNDKISSLYSVYHIFYVMQRNLCFIAVYLLKSVHCLYCPSYIAVSCCIEKFSSGLSALAIWRAMTSTSLPLGEIYVINAANGRIRQAKTMAPVMLKMLCEITVRLAALDWPMDASSAVIVVPMFAPKIAVHAEQEQRETSGQSKDRRHNLIHNFLL